MKLDFQAMEETVLQNFYGGEKAVHAKLHADGLGRIMLGRLEPGASIGVHTHDAGSEIVYVLDGAGKALYDGGEERLGPGDCHYCPKGHSHSLINDGAEDLTFFAVVPRQ